MRSTLSFEDTQDRWSTEVIVTMEIAEKYGERKILGSGRQTDLISREPYK